MRPRHGMEEVMKGWKTNAICRSAALIWVSATYAEGPNWNAQAPPRAPSPAPFQDHAAAQPRITPELIAAMISDVVPGDLVPADPPEGGGVMCPGGAVNETQPPGGSCAVGAGDTVNGGCNVAGNPTQAFPCGTTLCGISGFVPGFHDLDWYSFTLATPSYVTLTVTGDFGTQIALLNAACPPGAFAVSGAASGMTATASACLQAGNFRVFIRPTPPPATDTTPCPSNYVATLTCTPIGGGAPANNLCTGAFVAMDGDNPFSTCFATDSVGLTHAACTFDMDADVGQDVWFTYTATCTDNVTVSLCGGTTFDSKVAVYNTSDCGNLNDGTLLACDDESCGVVGGPSLLTFAGVQGMTYLIRVGGFGAATGQGVMNIQCGALCEPACGGGTQEDQGNPGNCGLGLPGSDFINGGCNLFTPAFSPISCDETVCGAVGTEAGMRDLDWYTLTVGEPTEITWTAQGNFPTQLFITEGLCPTFTIAAATGEACEMVTASACVNAGTYFLVIAPSVFAGVPCPSDYVATVTCAPCAPPPAPANNACSSATVVSNGVTNFDTSGASTDGMPITNVCGTFDAPLQAFRDVWFDYTAIADGPVTVSLCSSSFDTVLAVYQDCGICPPGDFNQQACNDEASVPGLGTCVAQSAVTFNAFNGVCYKIRVGGFGGASGAGTMNIFTGVSECPAFSTCPGGGSIIENEAACGDGTDFTNPGCNGMPPLFIPATVGTTICGTGRATTDFAGAQTRDTDWYEFANHGMPAGTTFTWNVNAEFPLHAAVLTPGAMMCPGTVLGTQLGPACATSSVQVMTTTNNQTIWGFVSTSQFEGVVCGAEYTAMLATGVAAVSIAASNPPNNHLDTLDTGTGTTVTAGIGGAGTAMQGGVQYATVSVTFSGPVSGGLQNSDIMVSCTGGTCPTASVMSGAGAGPYQLALSSVIPPLHCTTINFVGPKFTPNQRLQYRFSPGNVDLGNAANTQDLLNLILALNNGAAAANPARYNVNRMGAPNTQDLLRIIQLLNGVLTNQAYNLQNVAACPP